MTHLSPGKRGTALRRQSGFGERSSRPRELACVPPVESRDCDAVARRVDEPAVPEVDAHVADLCGLRAWAAVAEEDHVGGLETGERDALGLRHLPAHLIRRPPP